MRSLRAHKYERSCYKLCSGNTTVGELNIFTNHGKVYSSESKGNNYIKSHCSNEDPIINPCGIQMLPRSIYHQIFKKPSSKPVTEETNIKIKKHLSSHNLWGNPATVLPNIDFKLPELLGESIAEHFKNIAEKQCGGYREKLVELVSNNIPDIPPSWNFSPGWTRYCGSGETIQVDYPDEEAYVFDVEVCVQEGHFPTLATAVSSKYWYSWCSDQLFGEKVKTKNNLLCFEQLLF